MNARMRLPEEFLERMRPLLKDEYDSFISSYDAPSYRGLRLNPLKTSADEYAGVAAKACGGTDCERVPWCDEGFYFGEDVRPGIHPYHAAGLYYIQEPSAMLPGRLACDIIDMIVEHRGKVRVLDMCAAPGGKATQLAGHLDGRGILVANEPVPGRARILSQNMERMGIRNALTVCEMPDRLAEVFPGFFDLVVVDAPCSGEGMFRKDETAIEEWSTENVELCVRRGREILDAACRCLSHDGYIVYSTCTYEPAENEDAVAHFIIEEHNRFHVITPPVDGLSASDDGTYRIWPHRTKGEGHFAAVLAAGDGMDMSDPEGLTGSPDADAHMGYAKKRATETGSAPGLTYDRGLSREAVCLLEQFVSDTLTDEGRSILSGHAFTYGDNMYVVPQELAPYVKADKKNRALRIERAGLHIGELKKGRLEPSHSLAMALSEGMCVREENLKAEDDRVLKYLRGESVACDAAYKGYVIVCVDGHPLGWGKASGGVLKNHYPKGLRYPAT